MSGINRQNVVYKFEEIPVGGHKDYPIEKRSSVQVCLDQFKNKYGGWFRTKTFSQHGVPFVRVYRMGA